MKSEKPEQARDEGLWEDLIFMYALFFIHLIYGKKILGLFKSQYKKSCFIIVPSPGVHHSQ